MAPTTRKENEVASDSHVNRTFLRGRENEMCLEGGRHRRRMKGARRMKAPERIASAGTMGREGATGRTAIISAHSDPENLPSVRKNLKDRYDQI